MKIKKNMSQYYNKLLKIDNFNNQDNQFNQKKIPMYNLNYIKFDV